MRKELQQVVEAHRYRYYLLKFFPFSCSLIDIPAVVSDSVFHLFIQSQLSVQEIVESLDLGLLAADIILHSSGLPAIGQSASESSLTDHAREVGELDNVSSASAGSSSNTQS